MDAAAVAQVLVGELGGHWRREVLPGKSIHLVRPLVIEDWSQFGLGHRWSSTRRRPGPSGGGRPALKPIDGFTEGEVVKVTDEVDDVTGGAAAEAVEPLRDTAHRHRRGVVVVERATAHVPPTSRDELHTGGGDDLLDGMIGADAVDVHPGAG